MDYEVRTRDLLFGEAPRWRDGRLWFSDFHDHAVKSMSRDGEVRVELRIDDQPSGLGWMPDGSLLVVSMMKRQVLRRAPGGEVALHADLSSMTQFLCNDMVVDAEGGAYVGNFGFDLYAQVQARGVAGVLTDSPATDLYRIDPNGRVQVAASGLHFPNGSAITPDGRTLIVAETFASRLTAFDIDAEGALSARRTLATLPGRGPDGIALDAEGAVWVADALHAQCLRVSPTGEVVQVVATDHPCYACALGGADGHTLFMLTAAGSLEDVTPGPPDAAILQLRVEVGAAPAPGPR